MTTILVVDDDDIVAKSIELSLRRQGFNVLIAHTGVEGLKTARRAPPDLIILDVIMPGMDGFEVCRQLREDPLLSDIPVLFLTARGKTEDKIAGFRVGADDYLSKPFNLEEMILRVKAILRRTQPSAGARPRPRQLQVGRLTLDCRTYELTTPEKRVLLTPIQFDLLYHLMSHPGEIFSPERLLREVWDYPYDAGSPELVRVHVRNIRERIEPDPRNPTYLRTVPGHGYTIATE